MNIPSKLEDWNISQLEYLVESNYQEDESFDFKIGLPPKGDKRGKLRLRKTCCAFANSNGGFLVFGVDDKGEGSSRLVGINRDREFASTFGSYPSGCTPSVRWRARNPPIDIGDNKEIHVIQILKSWSSPHTVIDEHRRFQFPKRTNQGTENMDYSELRKRILDTEESILSINHLLDEISQLQRLARITRHNANQRTNHNYIMPLINFDMSLFDTLVSSSYVLLRKSQTILTDISRLRSLCHQLNNASEIARSTMSGKSIHDIHDEYWLDTTGSLATEVIEQSGHVKSIVSAHLLSLGIQLEA